MSHVFILCIHRISNGIILFLPNRATERYSLIFDNTMKLKHDLTSETQTKILSDFISEQQVRCKDKKNTMCYKQFYHLGMRIYPYMSKK